MSKKSSSLSLPPDAKSRLNLLAKIASSGVVDESQLLGGRSEQIDLHGFMLDLWKSFNVRSRDVEIDT